MAKKSTPKPKGGKGGGCKAALVSLIIIVIIGMVPAMATTNLMNPNLINWATTVTGNPTFSGTVTIDGTTPSSGTIDDNVIITGTHTFASGTGVFGVNGDGTVASSKNWAVTTADKLTVASVIVPTEVPIKVLISATMVNQTIFTADAGWKITGIKEVHSVVGAARNQVYIEKLTSTTAPASGTTVQQNGGFDLTAGINAVQSAVLSATPGDYTLASGDRLGIVFHGGASMTGVVGDLTIYLKRV